MPQYKPTQASFDYLKKMYSGFTTRPINFEFTDLNHVIRWVAVYNDGRKLQDYEHGVFRGRNTQHDEFINTFNT